jgi:hypothetical protein
MNMKRFTSISLFQNMKTPKLLGRGGTSRLPGLGLEKYRGALERSWQKLALLGLYAVGLFLGAKTAGAASSG